MCFHKDFHSGTKIPEQSEQRRMKSSKSSHCLPPSYSLSMLPADLQCAEFFKANCRELYRKGRGGRQAASLHCTWRNNPKVSAPVHRASAQTPKRVQHTLLGLGLHWNSQLSSGWEHKCFFPLGPALTGRIGRELLRLISWSFHSQCSVIMQFFVLFCFVLFVGWKTIDDCFYFLSRYRSI